MHFIIEFVHSYLFCNYSIRLMLCTGLFVLLVLLPVLEQTEAVMECMGKITKFSVIMLLCFSHPKMVLEADFKIPYFENKPWLWRLYPFCNFSCQSLREIINYINHHWYFLDVKHLFICLSLTPPSVRPFFCSPFNTLASHIRC